MSALASRLPVLTSPRATSAHTHPQHLFSQTGIVSNNVETSHNQTAKVFEFICATLTNQTLYSSATLYSQHMTDPASDPPSDAEAESYQAEYDAMLEQLDAGIAEIINKIEDDDLEDPDIETTRIRYYRTLGYLIRTKRQVLKDRTLEELAEEIETLKEHSEVDSVRID